MRYAVGVGLVLLTIGAARAADQAEGVVEDIWESAAVDDGRIVRGCTAVRRFPGLRIARIQRSVSGSPTVPFPPMV